jgi:general stress protein 26
MADSREDRDPTAASADDAVPATDPASEALSEVAPDRREFLRKMSGDAVRTAGRLAGFSSVIRRSVVAAGGAAIRDLDAPADDREVKAVATSAGSVEDSQTDEPPLQKPSHAPAAIPPRRDAVASLTPEQHDFLAMGAQAILAVNDPSGAPHLTSSLYHWDGTIVRLPGRLSTARAIDIDRDPRVSVLVQDRTTEAWVAITGTASLSSADTVGIEMLQILTRYFEADVAAQRWDELRLSGDQIVIQVRPVRFVWRPA